MNAFIHLIAILILGAGWFHHFSAKSSANNIRQLSRKISDAQWLSNDLPGQYQNAKDDDEKAALKKLIERIGKRATTSDETYDTALALADDIDNNSTFSGILLVMLTAGYAGICFAIYLLPKLAQRATHAVFDSGETVQPEPMSRARSKLAQGDYLQAIEAFREAAESDPSNRMPWMEIIKIQRDILHQPADAIETIHHLFEKQTWPADDASYFLFRLAELYHQDLEDPVAAAATLQQVIEQFPETRHSANARHQLQSWGLA